MKADVRGRAKAALLDQRRVRNVGTLQIAAAHGQVVKPVVAARRPLIDDADGVFHGECKPKRARPLDELPHPLTNKLAHPLVAGIEMKHLSGSNRSMMLAG